MSMKWAWTGKMEEVLNKAKENAGDALFVSSDEVKLSDCMTVMGLVPIPQLHRYPYDDPWAVVLKVAVKVSSTLESGPVGLPPELARALGQLDVTEFDFYFIVSD